MFNDVGKGQYGHSSSVQRKKTGLLQNIFQAAMPIVTARLQQRYAPKQPQVIYQPVPQQTSIFSNMKIMLPIGIGAAVLLIILMRR